MVVNVSPSQDNVLETKCSLEFAQRARKVELGRAAANVELTPGEGPGGWAVVGEDGAAVGGAASTPGGAAGGAGVSGGPHASGAVGGPTGAGGGSQSASVTPSSSVMRPTAASGTRSASVARAEGAAREAERKVEGRASAAGRMTPTPSSVRRTPGMEVWGCGRELRGRKDRCGVEERGKRCRGGRARE